MLIIKGKNVERLFRYPLGKMQLDSSSPLQSQAITGYSTYSGMGSLRGITRAGSLGMISACPDCLIQVNSLGLGSQEFAPLRDGIKIQPDIRNSKKWQQIISDLWYPPGAEVLVSRLRFLPD